MEEFGMQDLHWCLARIGVGIAVNASPLAASRSHVAFFSSIGGLVVLKCFDIAVFLQLFR